MREHRQFDYLFIAALLVAQAVPVNAELDIVRKGELINLVEQDCGSCHGMTLQGGLGPSLTPQSLRGKPKAAMIATVLHGRPGTPMPPWANLLSEQEVSWIIDTLYTGLDNAK